MSKPPTTGRSSEGAKQVLVRLSRGEAKTLHAAIRRRAVRTGAEPQTLATFLRARALEAAADERRALGLACGHSTDEERKRGSTD